MVELLSVAIEIPQDAPGATACSAKSATSDRRCL